MAFSEVTVQIVLNLWADRVEWDSLLCLCSPTSHIQGYSYVRDVYLIYKKSSQKVCGVLSDGNICILLETVPGFFAMIMRKIFFAFLTDVVLAFQLLNYLSLWA